MIKKPIVKKYDNWLLLAIFVLQIRQILLNAGSVSSRERIVSLQFCFYMIKYTDDELEVERNGNITKS